MATTIVHFLQNVNSHQEAINGDVQKVNETSHAVLLLGLRALSIKDKFFWNTRHDIPVIIFIIWVSALVLLWLRVINGNSIIWLSTLKLFRVWVINGSSTSSQLIFEVGVSSRRVRKVVGLNTHLSESAGGICLNGPEFEKTDIIEMASFNILIRYLTAIVVSIRTKKIPMRSILYDRVIWWSWWAFNVTSLCIQSCTFSHWLPIWSLTIKSQWFHVGFTRGRVVLWKLWPVSNYNISIIIIDIFILSGLFIIVILDRRPWLSSLSGDFLYVMHRSIWVFPNKRIRLSTLHTLSYLFPFFSSILSWPIWFLLLFLQGGTVSLSTSCSFFLLEFQILVLLICYVFFFHVQPFANVSIR